MDKLDSLANKCCGADEKFIRASIVGGIVMAEKFSAK